VENWLNNYKPSVRNGKQKYNKLTPDRRERGVFHGLLIYSDWEQKQRKYN
jgi:hypothetical protein